MKKLLIVCMLFALGCTQANAQELKPEDHGYFNHLSAGVTLGTDGIGIEVAAPLTYNFSVRTGIAFLPRFKYSKGVHLTDNAEGAFLRQDVDLEGKLKKFDFKLLVDWYPFKRSSFHATAGFYWGSGTVVDIYNKEQFINPSYYGTAGIELGDATRGPEYRYTMITDMNGEVKAELKVNSFKPYLGVGFGRAIPKGRVGVQCDFGVQFWGKPEVLGNMNYMDRETGEAVTRYEKIHYSRILSENKDYKDMKDAIKTIEKIRVYPVLNIRINGRIF